MARKQQGAADVWSALARALLDRWAEVHDRPGLKSVQRDQVRLDRRLQRLITHVRRLLAVVVVLALWNLALTAVLIWRGL